MINAKKIKLKASKLGKKIGLMSIKKIEEMLEESLTNLIERAGRKADISGRKIIKPEDFS